ncbi:MAG: protein BatD [Candidatus Eisenbacteria sp.]|nr:protein BatD [Candidatus Eisenbacteria bacterium]
MHRLRMMRGGRGSCRLRRACRSAAGPARLVIGLAIATLGILAAPGSSWADDPRIDLRLDRRQVPARGRVEMSVTLEGFSRRASKPEIPPVDGLSFHELGRSSNISWVNGRLSTSTTYTYAITTHRAGSYTIGPVQVEDGGTLYRSEPLELGVTAAGSGTAPGPPRGTSVPPRQEVGRGEPGGIFARILVEPREAFVDQQVTLRFRLYQREDVQLIDISEFVPPTAEGFWRESLGEQRDFRVELEGERYHVREIAWALFPTRAGELTIGPGRVTCYLAAPRRERRRFFSDFFDRGLLDRQAVPLDTEPQTILVRALSEEGRPEGFSGSVGRYAIETRLDVAEARQGEPFTLSVTIRGNGHIQTIGEPVWPAWEGLRVFDSGEAVSVSQAQDRVAGEKTFTRVLIANRAGTIELDPVRFVFFDPLAKRYRTITGEPLSIAVKTALGVGGEAGPSGIVSVGDDILYIHSGIGADLQPVRQRGLSAAVAVHGAPLLLLAAAAWVRRRRRALERNPQWSRRTRALSGARQALARLAGGAEAPRTAAVLAEILEAYLSAWLGRAIRGSRRSELRGMLREAEIPEAETDEILGLLDWAEEVRFGAGGDPAEAPRRAAAMGDLLRRLEAAFRRSPLGSGV